MYREWWILLGIIARRRHAQDMLDRMNVHELLALKNRTYRLNGGGIPPGRESDYGLNLLGYGGWVSLADIKRRLAHRPHVPNKAERRLARQEAAKSGRRGGRRNFRGRG